MPISLPRSLQWEDAFLFLWLGIVEPLLSKLIGLLAGWLAGIVMRGSAFGILGDIIIGVIGSLIGAFLFGLLGLGASGFIGSVAVAFVGAIVLILILRALTHAGATA